jgi:hypothetical protein
MSPLGTFKSLYNTLTGRRENQLEFSPVNEILKSSAPTDYRVLNIAIESITGGVFTGCLTSINPKKGAMWMGGTSIISCLITPKLTQVSRKYKLHPGAQLALNFLISGGGSKVLCQLLGNKLTRGQIGKLSVVFIVTDLSLKIVIKGAEGVYIKLARIKREILTE